MLNKKKQYHLPNMKMENLFHVKTEFQDQNLPKCRFPNLTAGRVLLGARVTQANVHISESEKIKKKYSA